ncbi:sensor histidine kinase [Nocardia xishanensis]|uniref:histidine kinase n=1 Tax=Nocardia xishanensis TaxID=238964 RepID=A0ABW7X0A2_9NOCA
MRFCEVRALAAGHVDAVIGRARRWPSLAVDAVLTVVVTVASVGPALVARAPWWIVALSVLASVPVWWRRRAPILALCLIGPAITVLACAHAMPALPYGTIVCVYAIAAYSPPRLRRGALTAVGIGVLVSLVLPKESPDSYGYAAMSFVTAWALGTGVRARRDRIAMLEERARRLEEERIAAVDRERLRIARDMHDIVTHSVGVMIVQAETGSLFTRADPARADAIFDGIAESGRAALHQLRHSLGALRGEATDPPHQPGIEAIPDLVELSRRGGLTASFDERGARRAVPGEIAVTAYRVVQEALTNTMKHARADSVRVSLHWGDEHLAIRVADDGISCDGARQSEMCVGAGGFAGRGLIGMRERVVGCGGTLSHGPVPDGFVVNAELPLGEGV